MCGINGIVSYDRSYDLENNINKMNDSTRHRGPDGEGIYICNNVALGHVRLSIIDVRESARQPMLSVNKNLILIFNGEIYNYKELKKQLDNYPFSTKSDSEVILASYIKWGESCIQKFNGMFSFAIYDKENNYIFAARDRFGIKPFYFYKDDKKFIFSSEIKGILSTEEINPVINEKVFYDFVVYNRTDHLDETCFSSVNNLRPGNKLTINCNNNKVDIVQWYKIPKIEFNEFSYKKTRDKLRDNLFNSVKMHLIGDVPVGAAISGGIDSSIIVSIMRLVLGEKEDINTFSAVYDENWEKDETKFINIVVEEKNLKSNFVYPNEQVLLNEIEQLIFQQEEPFSSASIFASWCVSRKASEKNIKVLLNGQGSDELFAYDYMAAYYFLELFKTLKWIRLLKEVTLFYFKQDSSKFTFKLFIFLLSPKFLKHKLSSFANKIVNEKFFNRFKNQSLFFREFFKASNLNESVTKHLSMKLHHLLRVEDKNTMMFGVEGRLPFLEKTIVSQAISIPSSFKVRNGVVKFILKEACKSDLPTPIYNRNNKVGYESPMSEWLKSENFKALIDEMLTSPIQPMKKYLNINYIKGLWERHKSNKGDFSSEIWKYFYLTKWYNIYFK